MLLPVSRSMNRLSIILLLGLLLSPFAWGQTASQIPQTGSIGTSGNTNNGDRDGTVVVFFEVPSSAPSTVYFGIYDPSFSGTAAINDSLGAGGTSYWTLVGGTGALSDPSSQLTTYSPYPSTQALAGTILTSFTLAANTSNAAWYYIGPFNKTSGELIGNKYYFKLVLQVPTTATGKNTFFADVSSTNSGNPTYITGAKSFAFDWPVIMGSNTTNSGQTYDFYPFVSAGSTGSITSHNWDIDNTPLSSNTLFNISGTSQGAVTIGGGSVDGSSSFALGTQVNGSWHWHAVGSNAAGGTAQDLAEVWFVNGSTVLRTYSTSVGAQTADHLAVTYNGGTLPTNGSGIVTIQAVDSSGNPQLIPTKVWVSVSGSATISASSNTSTSLPATGALVTTDGNGLATVTVMDATAETITVSTTNNFNGSDNLPLASASTTATVTFTSTAPTMTSASADTISTAGTATNATLSSITINANGGTILSGSTILIRVPSSLNTIFNTGSAPTVSSSPGGIVSGATFPGAYGGSVLQLTLGTDFTGTNTITISTGLQLAVAANVASSGNLQLSYDGGSTYPVTDSFANPTITINTAGTFTWKTTATTTAWSTAANWAGGVVPPAGADVVIPTGITGSQPSVDTGISSVHSLTIGSGSTLTTGVNGITVTTTTSISGTLTGGSGALIFSGTVSGGGALTASSTTTNIGGDLTTTGTFTANGGSVIINGTGAQTVNGYTFKNLEINKTSGTTVTSGGAWTVTGTLTMTRGTWAPGSFTHLIAGSWNDTGITFQPSAGTISLTTTGAAITQASSNSFAGLTIATGVAATLGSAVTLQNMTFNGTGSLDVTASNWGMTVTGNWTNNNGATAFTARAGTVTFTGASGAGPFTITPNGQSFANLVVNASGKTIQTTATLTASANLGVTAGTLAGGSATLSFGTISGSGTITTNGGTLTATSTGGTAPTVAVTTGVTLNGGATGLIIANALANAVTVSTGKVSLNGSVSTLSNAGTLTLNGALTATGAVTNTGGTLTVPNTITLTMNGTGNSVTGGTLLIASGGIITGANDLTIGASGTLDTSGSLTCGNFTSSGIITNTATNTITSSGTAVAISGTFGPTATNGTLILTGASPTLNAAVQIGNLQVNSTATAASLVTNSLSVAGTLDIQGSGVLSAGTRGVTVIGAATIDGTFNGGSGTDSFAAVAGAGTFNATSGATTFSSDLSVVTFNHDNGAVTLTGGTVGAYTFYDVTIAGAIIAGASWTLNHNWTLTSGSVSWGTFGLVVSPASTSIISGTNSFYSLTANAPGKTIKFADSLVQTVTNTLSLQGGSGNVLTLTGTGTSGWTINMQGGTQTLAFLNISYGNAATNDLTASTSFNGTNNNLLGTGKSWLFNVSTLTWTGNSSTDWSASGNWNLGYVPNPADTAIIPTVTTYPVLTANTSIANLTLQTAAATLGLGGFTLTVSTTGTFSNSGTVTVGASTLTAGIFSGSGTLNVNGGTVAASGTGGTIGALSITGSANINGGATGLAVTSQITGNNVNITTTGIVSLNENTTGTSTLTVSSGMTSLNGVSTVTTLAVNGTSTFLQGGFALSATTANIGNGSALTFTNDAGLTVSGLTTIAVGATNNFSLLNTGNSLAGVKVTSGLTISLYSTSAVTLNASTVSGNLIITSGGLSQSGIVSVTGTTSLTGTGASQGIDLSTSVNTFTLPVTFTNTGATNNVALKAGSIQLGSGSSTGGTLAVTTSTGAITEGGAITVGGATTLTAGGNAINLGSVNSFNGTVTFSNTGSNNVTLTAGSIQLGTGSSTAGALNVTTSTGGITQSGAIAVTGTTTLTAGANPINLGSSNTLSGIVTFSNNTTGNSVTLKAVAIQIGSGSSTDDNLSVTTTAGTISQSGPITVGGTTALIAGTNAINLGSANTFNNTVTFSNSGGANNVTLNGGAIQLGASATNGTLSMTTTGDITQTATSVSVGGTATLNAGSNAVTLGSATNSFSTVSATGGAITLNAGGGYNVSGAASTSFDASTAGGDLTILSGQTVSNSSLLSTNAITLHPTGNLAIAGKISTVNALVTLNPGLQITLNPAANPVLQSTGAATSGDLTFSRPVVLSVSSTITSAAANVVFAAAATVDGSSVGGQTLSIGAGTGGITFNAAVGAGKALNQLAVTSASSVLTAQAVTANGSPGVSIAGGGAVTVQGVVTTPSGFSSSGSGAFSLTGSITTSAGTGGVAITSTASTVGISGAITTASGGVSIDSGGGTGTTIAAAGVITATGAAAVNIGQSLTGTLTTGGNISTANGLVRWWRAATLSGAVSVSTGGAGFTASQTVGGAGNTLTLNSGTTGSITFSTDVDNLPLVVNQSNGMTASGIWNTTTAAAVTINDTVAGQTISFAGSQTNISTLTANNGGNAYIVQIVGSATTSTITTASLPFTGVLKLGGGASASISFTNGVTHTTGSTTAQGTVTTAGGSGQNISLANLTLANTLALNAGLTGTVQISGTVTGAGFALSTTGDTTFGGTATGLASLTVNNKTAINTTTITTSGPQTYTGAVTLGANAVLTSSSSGDITFSSTIVNGTTQNLTIAAGIGNVLLGSTVGSAGTPLGTLLVTGGTGTTAYIKPSGNIWASSMTFTGPVQLQSSVALDTATAGGGAILFSATSTVDAFVAGIQSLAVTAGSGQVTFSANVGTTTAALAGLAVTSTNGSAAAISTLSVATSGSAPGTQTYTGRTTINGTWTTADQNVTVTQLLTLAGASNITAGLSATSSTIDLTPGVNSGAFAFNVNATAGSQVSTGTIKAGPTTGTGTVSLGFNSNTTTVGGAGTVQLLGTVAVGTLRVGATAVIGTTLTVTSSVGAIRFNSAVNSNTGAEALTLNAATSLNLFNSVGGGTQFSAVTLTGATAINLGNTTIGGGPYTIKTSGNQTYNSPVTLAQNYTLDSSSSSGDVVFATGATIAASSSGGQSLTVNAGTGNAVFNSAVGTTRLGALLVTAGTGGKFIKLGGNLTATSVTLTGPVQLLSTVTLDTSPSGNIALSSTLDSVTPSSFGIGFTAGTGTVTVTGTVGGSALAAITVNSAGGVTFSNPVTAASFTQTNGTGTTLFSSTQTYTSNFSFNGSALTVSGTVSVSGTSTITNGSTFTIGTSAPWSSTGAFHQNGAGSTSIGSSVTTTNTALTFDQAITLTGNIQLSTGATGTTLTLTGAVNADAFGNNRQLTLAAGTAGTIVVNGTVGATQLDLLALSSGTSATFSQPVTTTTLTTTANVGAVTLANTTNVTTTSVTTFLNQGLLTLGAPVSPPILTFTGGLTTTGSATNPSSTSIGGTIRTAGAGATTNTINLGAVALLAASTLDTTNNVGGAVGANLTVGTLSGTFDLTTMSGTAGTTTFAGVGSAGLSLGSSAAATSLTLSNGLKAVFPNDVYLKGSFLSAIEADFTKSGTTQVFVAGATAAFNNLANLTGTTQLVSFTVPTITFNNAAPQSELRVGTGGVTLTGSVDFSNGKLTGASSGTQDITFGTAAVSTVTFPTAGGAVNLNAYSAGRNRIVFTGSQTTTWSTGGQTVHDILWNKTSSSVTISGTGTASAGTLVSDGNASLSASAGNTLNLTDANLTFSASGATFTVGTGAVVNASTTVANAGTSRGLFFTSSGTAPSVANSGTFTVSTTYKTAPVANYSPWNLVSSGTRAVWTGATLNWTGGDLALGNIDYQGTTLTEPATSTLYLNDSNVHTRGLTLNGQLSPDGFPSASANHNLALSGTLDYSAAGAAIVPFTSAGTPTPWTVTFDNASAAVSLKTNGVGATKNLYHLTLSGTGAGNKVSVTGPANLSLGLWGDLTENTAAALDLTNQMVVVRGNLVLLPNGTTGTLTNTGSTIVLASSAAVNVNLSAAALLNDLAVRPGAFTITQLADVNVRRFMAFSGVWNTGGFNLTATEDFVAYGSGYRPYTLTTPAGSYNPSDDGEISVSRSGTYSNRLGYPYFGLNGGQSVTTLHSILSAAFGLTLSDGTRTTIPDATTGNATSASFLMSGGKSLTVGGNFYNYGASMTAGSNWTLSLPVHFGSSIPGDPATVGADWFGRPFAVALSAVTGQMTITHSQANNPVAAAWSSFGQTGAALLTLVDLSSGNNAKWDNVAPTIDTTHTRTRFDNLVEIAFSKPVLSSGSSGGALTRAINQTAPLDNLRFNGGATNAGAVLKFENADGLFHPSSGPYQVGTSGEYTTSAVPTDDAQTFVAFQTQGSVTWNTDATGTSAGGGTGISTDRSGNSQTTVPNITVEKGHIFDASGNPLTNYGVNGAPMFTSTLDAARPVLIKVDLGQAAKNFPPNARGEDGHNYWHLVWSEPVNLDGTSQLAAADKTALNAGAAGSIPVPYASGGSAVGSNLAAVQNFGDSFTVVANTVQLTGLAQYMGNLYRGSRTMNGGDVTLLQTTVPTTNSLARSAAKNDLYVYLVGASTGSGYTANWDGFWWGDTTSAATLNRPFTVPGTYVSQVTDLAANPVEDVNVVWPVGADPKANYTVKNDLTVNTAAEVSGTPILAHSGWESDDPDFAPYTVVPGTYEVIPLDPTNTGADASEVHIHILSNVANSGQTWNSLTGHPDDINTTHFGVRDSSFTDFVNGFQMKLTSSSSGFLSLIAPSWNTAVNNNLFDGPGSTTAVSIQNDGYFKLAFTPPADGTWKSAASYSFLYDRFKGMATNLAGRLIKSTPTIGSLAIDRTPPTITLTLAANGGTKVYVQFSRQVIAIPIGGYSGLNSLAGSNVFQLLNTSNGNSIASVALLDATGTSDATHSQTFQQALLTLAKPLQPQDYAKVTLNATDNLPTITSTISGASNDMNIGVLYPISNLGIDLVQPIWASDGSGGEANASGTDRVIHDFTGLDALTARDITMQVNVGGGTTFTSLPLRLFYDLNVPSNEKTADGLWLPTGIFQPPNQLSPTLAPFAVVPTVNNGAVRNLAPTATNSAGNLKTFVVPGSDSEIKSGSELQFIFRVGALYSVRGLSPTDPTQIGVYRIPLKGIKEQKNGVTILHNVIDPTQGQKTEILYTMKKSGVVTAQVFALDGSLVRILQRGRQAPGDYSLLWDGKNEGGKIVARGVYFIRVVAPDTDETRNVLVIK